MTIELSSFGGGQEETKSASILQTISPGVTGVIATIPSVSNQRVVLTFLGSAGGGQGGISVNFGGSQVLPTTTVADAAATSIPSASTLIGGNIPTMTEIVGGLNQNMEIIKDAGNTTSPVLYSYQYKGA